MSEESEILDHDSGALRQTLWDIYEILGFDTDGARTPAGVHDLRRVVLDAAHEFRKDHDELIDEAFPSDPVGHLVTPASKLAGGYTDCCATLISALDSNDFTVQRAWECNCIGMFKRRHPASEGSK
jgi:hypothetical protein